VQVRFKVASALATVAITLVLVPIPALAETTNASRTIVINFVGDVHGESAIKREALASLKKYFSHADLNIFNLETAITDAKVKEKKAVQLQERYCLPCITKERRLQRRQCCE